MGFHTTELITVSSVGKFNDADRDVLGWTQRLLGDVEIAKMGLKQVVDGMTYPNRNFSMKFHATELITVSSVS
jgi:hypothetical protein